jgi:phospholipase C
MKVRVSRPLCTILSLLVVTLSSLLLLAGCGSVGPGSDTPTVTITANPTSIAAAGASSTLTVAATNATTVTVTGSDGSSYNMTATGGTQSVKPTKTTTYTATANGAGGKTTATATVTVGTGPSVTITANPTSVAAGASSTLTVAATNATAVTITGTDGSSYNLAATGGTQSVTPAATTTYTATATGAAGSTPATATATVTVTGSAKPTVTVTANPATITAGSASTLTIAATNATSLTVAGSDGSSYTLASATGGTQAVSPAATTTYTVTATGAGGTATATAIVTVVPAPPPPVPTVTLSASPTTINAGGTSTLTVAATNATNLVIAGSDGTAFSSPALPVTGGTEPVTPKLTTTYTATATNATGSVTATVVVTVVPTLTVTITASPSSIAIGSSSTLTVVATSATAVTVKGTDGNSYTLAATGGTQVVSPTTTTSYTATADGSGTPPVTASTTVTVVPPGSVKSLNHVIFMLQENHSFDNYFGLLNPYRQSHGYDKGTDGTTYDVDGLLNGSEDKRNGQTYAAVRGSTSIKIPDQHNGTHTLYKLKSTCIDDASSAWTESFGDVSLGNALTTRAIRMNGYASNGDGFANSKCPGGVGPCTGYTDVTGDRTMGYYDEGFLNYYYYMASQFALSDRWFSPIESKSIPNRIATFTGGTTQGLTQDPGGDDHLGPATINNIFQALDGAGVSWKIYYTVTNADCDPEDCKKGSTLLPSTTFSYLTYSFKYVGGSPSDPSGCVAPKQPDSSNSFCVDPHHIAYLRDTTYGYFADLKNNTLPSFAFIESGSGLNDEHPGYQQSVLTGQFQVASIMNALMTSTSWGSSAFFFAYDEGGGPYDHVPPVPKHTNDFTDLSAAGDYPTDVSGISVQPDSFYPCVLQTGADPTHCDLRAGQPGTNTGDAAGPPPGSGFGAQVGFRIPNMVISPFVKKHYVSHVPMDHTAVIKFVEDRFIGSSAHLTARDAAQPNLLDFFDFTGVEWASPPTPPAPVTATTLGYNPCTPQTLK